MFSATYIELLPFKLIPELSDGEWITPPNIFSVFLIDAINSLNSFLSIEKKESTDVTSVNLKCFSIREAPKATEHTDAVVPIE